MNMVRMVATQEHTYAGHKLAVDEEYDCEEQHVELVQKLGWARHAQAYQTRHMTAETPRRRRRK